MTIALVIAEQRDGKLRAASLHAISLAQRWIAAAGSGEIWGVVLGDSPAAAAQSFAQYGLKKVFAVADAGLKHYSAEGYASIVVDLCKKHPIKMVTATATQTGKDLLPRIAAGLNAGMVSDVIEVLSAVSFKRPMLAGNLIATVEVATPVLVLGARQSAWEPVKATGQAGAVESIAAKANLLGAEVLSMESVKSERPELGEARIIVTGGRGMKVAENFQHIAKLADLLGGAMGATRAVCDAGLVPNDLQVGQTGKIVAPDLYIAVGVSGAIQHIAGMKNSKVIVAINKDPEAPIFQVADYGLVAKWEDTLPALTEKVAALKKSAE